MRVRLKPAVSIAGVITDENGVGIPAARVRLHVLTIHGVRAVSLVDEVIADSKGRYEIDAIVPEREAFDYKLAVNAAGYGPVKYKQISIETGAGEVVEIAAIKLVPADTLVSGVVIDKRGNPAVSMPITVHGTHAFEQPKRSTATDSHGRFVVKRICKGPLTIQANAANSPSGYGVLYAQGGDQNVKVVIGEKRVHTTGKSLIGKHLPALTEFEIEPRIEPAEGKRTLVCFFDIKQRPSRYCMFSLSKNIRKLERNNIQPILIQSEPIDRENLDRQLKRFNVSIPVGMIKENKNKIRFDWGIESLPWFTLTDTNHIVQAEGFGINDLSEKIQILNK